MSKNRELGNIGNLSGTAGQSLISQSDGSYLVEDADINLTTAANYTVFGADPGDDENPSSAGAIWVNKETGAVFICTDATTDANVWKGLTFAEFALPYTFQGALFGYTSGGGAVYNSGATYNIIDKFPFTSDGDASDVGDLIAAIKGPSGQSSSDNGYTSGGRTGPNPYVNTIQKFPFSSDASAADTADLSSSRGYLAGHSSSDNGYTSGGAYPIVTTIDRFPFSSDFSGTATNVGNIYGGGRYLAAGHSSSDYGYTSGGNSTNIIGKFPFASDWTGTATNVGTLTANRQRPTGQSSSYNGYTSGGTAYPNHSTVIDRFPFASDANASDVADLSIGHDYAAGQSSNSDGYTSGGKGPGDTTHNVIDKFPFSSDFSGTATDIGDLTQARTAAAGHQY